jgi:hypothetical protein
MGRRGLPHLVGPSIFSGQLFSAERNPPPVCGLAPFSRPAGGQICILEIVPPPVLRWPSLDVRCSSMRQSLGPIVGRHDQASRHGSQDRQPGSNATGGYPIAAEPQRAKRLVELRIASSTCPKDHDLGYAKLSPSRRTSDPRRGPSTFFVNRIGSKPATQQGLSTSSRVQRRISLVGKLDSSRRSE